MNFEKIKNQDNGINIKKIPHPSSVSIKRLIKQQVVKYEFSENGIFNGGNPGNQTRIWN